MLTFGFLEGPDLIVVLVLALLIFGPGKLPDVAKSLGRGIREFRSATNKETRQDERTKPDDKTTQGEEIKQDEKNKQNEGNR